MQWNPVLTENILRHLVFPAVVLINDGEISCMKVFLFQFWELLRFREAPGSQIYWHGLILIPAWIKYHMLNEVWYEVTYPFSNFNGATNDIERAMEMK